MGEKQSWHRADIYHIRVKGTLDDKWADWFEGFVMASRGNGETLLTGTAADQAALQGVLTKIHSLGLPILLVARTGCPCPGERCSRHRNCSECAGHYEDKGLPFCFRERSRWDKRCAGIIQAG